MIQKRIQCNYNHNQVHGYYISTDAGYSKYIAHSSILNTHKSSKKSKLNIYHVNFRWFKASSICYVPCGVLQHRKDTLFPQLVLIECIAHWDRFGVRVRAQLQCIIAAVCDIYIIFLRKWRMCTHSNYKQGQCNKPPALQFASFHKTIQVARAIGFKWPTYGWLTQTTIKSQI